MEVIALFVIALFVIALEVIALEVIALFVIALFVIALTVILCVQEVHIFDRGGKGGGDDKIVGDEGKEESVGTSTGDGWRGGWRGEGKLRPLMLLWPINIHEVLNLGGVRVST